MLFAATILLSISSNSFITGIIGPGASLQYDRHKIFSYCVLLFTVFLSFGFSDVSIHPVTQFVNAMIVCILFIMISSLTSWYFYTCFLLVGMLLVSESFRQHYKKDPCLNKTFLMVQYIGTTVILFTSVMGIITHDRAIIKSVSVEGT